MALWAIKRGAPGDLISARAVRLDTPLDNEFTVSAPEGRDWREFRLAGPATVRAETPAERTERTRPRTPAERAREARGRAGFEAQLVKALAARFGVSEDAMWTEIENA